MFSSLYNLYSAIVTPITDAPTTESLPQALVVSAATVDDNIFYGTEERTTRFEEPGIRVYGSHDDNPIVYASALNQTSLNVEDDEAYYAAHPPASSSAMTLTFFNFDRAECTEPLLNKSAICMTNQRPPTKKQDLNTVDIVANSTRYGAYARKISLFSTNDAQEEVNPQNYQMVVHGSAAPR